MTNSIASILARLHHEEEGQGMVEYMLIIVFIALAATVGMSSFASALNSLFVAVGTQIGLYV